MIQKYNIKDKVLLFIIRANSLNWRYVYDEETKNKKIFYYVKVSYLVNCIIIESINIKINEILYEAYSEFYKKKIWCNEDEIIPFTIEAIQEKLKDIELVYFLGKGKSYVTFEIFPFETGQLGLKPKEEIIDIILKLEPIDLGK